MAVNYIKLWHLLLDRHMKKRDLQRLANVSEYHMKRLTRNESVPTETLCKIMGALDCSIDDIAEFSPDDPTPIKLKKE